MKLTRRHVLGLGGLSAASMFLPSLGKLEAAPAAKVRRVLFIYAEGGAVNPDTIMRPPGSPTSSYDPYDPEYYLLPDDSEWDFDLTKPSLTESDFSRIARPFFRHRDKMLLAENLSMLSSSQDHSGDEHATGHIAALSATAGVSLGDVRNTGTTPSIDQRIHDHLVADDPAHQTLAFRCQVDEPFHGWLYRKDGAGGIVRVTMDTDPKQAFERLFPAPTEEELNDPLDLARDRVLATAISQFDRLAPRMSKDDRIKLESHRDMVAALKTRLRDGVNCASPNTPEDTSQMSPLEAYHSKCQSFTEMIALAFSCGLSRVASLGISGYPLSAIGLSDGDDIHHLYEHPSDPYQKSPEQAAAQEAMTKRQIFQSEQVAKIIDILAETPEGSGSVLDNTLVVYINELATGSHWHELWPVFMFGGFGGAVTPGRYIKYALNNVNPYGRNSQIEWSGVPHSQLYVSICRAFGMNTDYIMHKSLPGSVPHKNITGTVDMSGPLRLLKA
jgi:hypothetical protein